MRKVKVKQADLIAELNDLFLREGTEMSERGFFQKAKANLSHFGGSIDKNMEQLARLREVVISLSE